MGLGDVVEKVTKATGIKNIVEGLTDDCGCDKRKHKLNTMFPFYTAMTDEQKKEWEQLRDKWNGHVVTATDQEQAVKLYNAVFRKRAKTSRCAPCVKRIFVALEDVYQLCEL